MNTATLELTITEWNKIISALSYGAKHSKGISKEYRDSVKQLAEQLTELVQVQAGN